MLSDTPVAVDRLDRDEQFAVLRGQGSGKHQDWLEASSSETPGALKPFKTKDLRILSS